MTLSQKQIASSYLPATFPPGSQIDHFLIVEMLGTGGFSEVYSVHDCESLNRPTIALKVMRMGLNSTEFLSRFEKEHQILRRLDDPGIVKVFESGITEDGRPYFVMEQIEGLRITDYCDSESLTLESRVELFIDVCQAVHHAHQKGIIHRDLKPANILVTDKDGVSVPRVIDFGLAKAIETWHESPTHEPSGAWVTGLGVTMGTPGYISPEQTDGTEDTDTLSDAFSLGVVLYELVAQRPPWPHETWKQILHSKWSTHQRENAPLKPSSHGPLYKKNRRIDDDLDTICLKALATDRNLRYESVSQLATDLKYWLRGDPILARPPSLAYRVRKLMTRYRWQSATVFALLGLCLVTAAFSFTLAVRERNYASHYRSLNDLANANSQTAEQQRDAALKTAADLAFQLPQQFEADEIFIDEIQLSMLEIAKHGLEQIEAITGGTDESDLAKAVVLLKQAELHGYAEQGVECLQCFDESEQLLRQLIARKPKDQQIVQAFTDVVVARFECILNEDYSSQLERFGFAVNCCRESTLDNTPEGSDKFALLLLGQAQCQMWNESVAEAIESLREAEQILLAQNATEETQTRSLLMTTLDVQAYTALVQRLNKDLPAARQLAAKTLEQIELLEKQTGEEFPGFVTQLSCFELLGCLSNHAEKNVEPKWRDSYVDFKRRLLTYGASDSLVFERQTATVMILVQDRVKEGMRLAATELMTLCFEMAEARLAVLPDDTHTFSIILGLHADATEVELESGSRQGLRRAVEQCFKAFACFERVKESGKLIAKDWANLTVAVECLTEDCKALLKAGPQQEQAEAWARKILLWSSDQTLTQKADKQHLTYLQARCAKILSTSQSIAK